MATPDTCPNCSAFVPPKARACPECGADESTGWSEEAQLDRLGIPSEDFDYDEYVREEFGGEQPAMRPKGIGLLWWIVAILLILVFLSVFL